MILKATIALNASRLRTIDQRRTTKRRRRRPPRMFCECSKRLWMASIVNALSTCGRPCQIWTSAAPVTTVTSSQIWGQLPRCGRSPSGFQIYRGQSCWDGCAEMYIAYLNANCDNLFKTGSWNFNEIFVYPRELALSAGMLCYLKLK